MCDKPHLNPCGIPQLKVGRDVQGRFRPGNAGGPGNPFARKVAALRKALLDSLSEQDLKDMVEILKQQARQGDKAAIKLLLQYCVGKPDSPKDPDRMDVDEWQRLRQMRVGQQEFEKTIHDVPACLACYNAETYWPCEAQDGPRWPRPSTSSAPSCAPATPSQTCLTTANSPPRTAIRKTPRRHVPARRRPTRR